MNKIYFGLGINPKTANIVILSFNPSKSICKIKSEKGLKEANCTDYKVFCLDDNTEKLRSELLWWLSEFGISKLDGQDIINKICDAISEAFKQIISKRELNNFTKK
jgi:hypothetical protein